MGGEIQILRTVWYSYLFSWIIVVDSAWGPGRSPTVIGLTINSLHNVYVNITGVGLHMAFSKVFNVTYPYSYSTLYLALLSLSLPNPFSSISESIQFHVLLSAYTTPFCPLSPESPSTTHGFILASCLLWILQFSHTSHLKFQIYHVHMRENMPCSSSESGLS